MRYRLMRYRVVKRDLQTGKNVHFLYDRRSGLREDASPYVSSHAGEKNWNR